MARNNKIEDSALESYPVKERFNKKATGTIESMKEELRKAMKN